MNSLTKETQYNDILDIAASSGISSLGLMTNQVWKERFLSHSQQNINS